MIVGQGEPDWKEKAELLAAEKAEVVVSLPELLRGRTVLPEIHLIKPKLSLERRKDGGMPVPCVRDGKQQRKNARNQKICIPNHDLHHNPPWKCRDLFFGYPGKSRARTPSASGRFHH